MYTNNMAADSFNFDWDTSDSEEFEGFGPEDFLSDGSDIELSDSDWSSDDETPLVDIIPLAGLTATSSATRADNSTPETERRWTENLRPVHLDDFTGESGATEVLPPEAKEKDFFHLIFPVCLFNLLAMQTNLYASQRTSVKPDPAWTPTTAEEMMTFVGLTIYMSLVDLPTYKSYWSQDWLFKTSLPMIMKRLRFEKLCQYFHLNDMMTNPARGRPGHDKLHHVRPVLNTIQRTIADNYKPGRDVAIDEAMVAYKGRLSFKQYLPAKPTKFGIKVWERADSRNGYVDKLQVYTGKEDTTMDQKEIGLAARVVRDLTRDITGSYRHIYVDNFFSSPALFDMLFRDGIYACGTCRSNRKGYPCSVNKDAVRNKGDFVMMQSGNLLATAWNDNKTVTFLSTNCDPTKFTEVRRKNKNGTERTQLAPEVVKKYSANMNAVDRADQLRTYCSTARKSHKWWKYLFSFLLDTAIVNAFILMKESTNHIVKSRTGKVKIRSQLEFKQNLCHQLIGNTRVTVRRKRSHTPDVAGGDHWPCKMRVNRCRECGKAKIRKESSYGCRKCGVNLCVICFEPFHKQIAEE